MSASSHVLYADDTNVFINVNGQRIYPDVLPFIQNSRTLVPVRGIFEKLGADVQWIQDNQSIIISYKGTTINMQINNTTASINGVQSPCFSLSTAEAIHTLKSAKLDFTCFIISAPSFIGAVNVLIVSETKLETFSFAQFRKPL